MLGLPEPALARQTATSGAVTRCPWLVKYFGLSKLGKRTSKTWWEVCGRPATVTDWVEPSLLLCAEHAQHSDKPRTRRLSDAQETEVLNELA